MKSYYINYEVLIDGYGYENRSVIRTFVTTDSYQDAFEKYAQEHTNKINPYGPKVRNVVGRQVDLEKVAKKALDHAYELL